MAKGFPKGDPRAAAAGRKGGSQRKGKGQRTPEYILGYRTGARNARRHVQRWIADAIEDASRSDRIGTEMR